MYRNAHQTSRSAPAAFGRKPSHIFTSFQHPKHTFDHIPYAMVQLPLLSGGDSSVGPPVRQDQTPVEGARWFLVHFAKPLSPFLFGWRTSLVG